MKKKSKAANMVENILFSLIVTIVAVSLPFMVGVVLTTPNTEVVNVVILVLGVVIEAIIIWMSVLTDLMDNDAVKEEKEDDI